jgi:hypothetical protein
MLAGRHILLFVKRRLATIVFTGKTIGRKSTDGTGCFHIVTENASICINKVVFLTFGLDEIDAL